MAKTVLKLLALLGLLTACSVTSSSNRDFLQENTKTDTILVTVNTNENDELLGSPARIQSYNTAYARNTRARQSLNALSSDYKLTARDVWPMESLGVLCQVFELPAANSQRVLNALMSDPRVESVQLMNSFRTLGKTESRTTQSKALVSNSHGKAKNYRPLQHYLDLLDIDSAHQVVTGRNVTVAIIDTHIDAVHPNLSASLSSQHNVLSNPGNSAADAHGYRGRRHNCSETNRWAGHYGRRTRRQASGDYRLLAWPGYNRRVQQL